jgi:hypothetical protein
VECLTLRAQSSAKHAYECYHRTSKESEGCHTMVPIPVLCSLKLLSIDNVLSELRIFDKSVLLILGRNH